MYVRKVSKQEQVRVAKLWADVKTPQEFWGDVSRNTRLMLKAMLEGTLEIWRDEWVELDWHQPAEERRTYRNGYYRRKRWPTELGPLENVRVPRCRDRGLTKRMFRRLKNHRKALAGSVTSMLLAGVSTRRVGELLDKIIGQTVSAGQVSRLAMSLNAAVRGFHTRPLHDKYLYLILDAIHLKARGTPRLVQTGLRRTRKRVVLVAYGITCDGIREIVGYRLAGGETTEEWERFLWDLHRRGLKGGPLKLITTDGGGGVQAAAQSVYYFVARQRCWFHKMQNVAGQVKKKDRQEILHGMRAVYTASTRRAAEEAYILWARSWKDRYPKAVKCVEEDLELLLAVFALPEAHRPKVRTTNPIERWFREVRRRTQPIGTFVNDASIERIVYGLVAYMNEKNADCVCREFRSKNRAA